MTYEKKVFNENSLRKIVKETSRAELEKQLKGLRFEMKRLWDFLNQQKDAITVLNEKIKEAQKK